MSNNNHNKISKKEKYNILREIINKKYKLTLKQKDNDIIAAIGIGYYVIRNKSNKKVIKSNN